MPAVHDHKKGRDINLNLWYGPLQTGIERRDYACRGGVYGYPNQPYPAVDGGDRHFNWRECKQELEQNRTPQLSSEAKRAEVYPTDGLEEKATNDDFKELLEAAPVRVVDYVRVGAQALA